MAVMGRVGLTMVEGIGTAAAWQAESTATLGTARDGHGTSSRVAGV